MESNGIRYNQLGVPADPDQINRHVSGESAISEDAQAIIDALGESEDDNQSSRGIVFNHQTYYAETLVELIDMAGNKNMIVTLSASDIILPTVISGGLAIADGNLATTGITVGNLYSGSSETTVGIVDFGSIINGILDYKEKAYRITLVLAHI